MNLKLYNKKTISESEFFISLPNYYKEKFFEYCKIFPFRTNNYVINELIDLKNPIEDPIFHINFFPVNSLTEAQYENLKLLTSDIEISNFRKSLNPDSEYNSLDVPKFEGKSINGLQHKFKDVCIIFPLEGQQCHAYCNFCFRWAQFIPSSTDIPYYSTNSNDLHLDYIANNKEINEIIFTGGDPIIMNVNRLEKYILPFLEKRFSHISNIRIGTKSLSFWPYRFLSDIDSDKLLKLFDIVIKSGKHLSIMAHFNHFKELETDAVQKAMVRIQNTGAVIRTQTPLLNLINNDATVLSKMWNLQVKLGCVPYYLFIERPTGASNAYKIPLYKTLEIYKEAFGNISGLARTVRGPVMSTKIGKIEISGITKVNEKKMFILKLIRAKDEINNGKIFFSAYSEDSYWLNDLSEIN